MLNYIWAGMLLVGIFYASGVCGVGGDAVYYDGRSDGALGGTDGDRVAGGVN